MKWTLRHAVTATLAYADLFQYPLTRDELFRWLITDTQISSKQLVSEVSHFNSSSGFYSLSSGKYIAQRKKREIISEKKWNIARQIADILIQIPTIYFIGVSGGLSMNNTDEDDDIDFFFIVASHTLWITRICVLIILQLLGKRRKIGSNHNTNKICANMFVDESSMRIPDNEQDLYTAHEVLQLVPLKSKYGIYSKFLQQNKWTNRYLMNAYIEKQSYPDSKREKTRMIQILILLLRMFESPVYLLQVWYMRNHRTKEVVSDTYVRFHPNDIRVFIRKNYFLRLQKYNVPLDSMFFLSLQ